MKYLVVLIACAYLFTGCNRDKNVEPTSSYDTLGIQWRVVERPNVIYYFQDHNAPSYYTSNYADQHEAAYAKLNDIFKAQLPRKLRYFVWNDPDVAAQRLGYPLGFAVGRECVCHVHPAQTRGHEITHILSYWADGVPWQTYRRLVTEGVAVAFDLSDRDRIMAAKLAGAGHGITSVAELWEGNMTDAPEEVFYPIAGAFMEHLYKQSDRDRFIALIKNQDIESAVSIYGLEKMQAIIAEFDAKMGFQ
jgi:hypothetical protein